MEGEERMVIDLGWRVCRIVVGWAVEFFLGGVVREDILVGDFLEIGVVGIYGK